MNNLRQNGGFALLITITLIAFLVLLLVSLASLTRVETLVASNNQQLGQARQNALMAINLALGQLQQYAGPDQRVSTTADLIADKDKSGTASTASTTLVVKNGARYWTAIWGNGRQVPSGYTDRYRLPPDKITERGVSPVLLNWLVSGNEKTTFTLQASDGSVVAGSGSDSPLFLPDGDVNIPAGATALSTDITIKNKSGSASPAALLVGPNSVGAGATGDYVVAPIVEIKAVAGITPGLGATATPVLGRYAWWVGDDGVKAQVNLRNGYQASGAASDRIYSFIINQRSSVASMDRDNSGNVIGADFNPDSAAVINLVSLGQLPLGGVGASGATNLAVAAQNRFHDITTHSLGVLSDVYNGGLKKDITADIADTSSTTGYRPADDEPIFTPVGSGEANLPTWGHLRSWARRHPSSSAVAPALPSDTEAGFSPVVSYASLGLSTYVDTSDANTIHVSVYPVVVLSNPYPYDISAANYDLGFQMEAGSCLYYRTAAAGTTTRPSTSDFTTVATLDLGTFTLIQGEKTPAELIGQSPNTAMISFAIEGSVIPAGETHVYVLDAAEDGSAYQAGRLLKRAPDASVIGLTNCLELTPAIPVSIPVVPAPDERKLVVWSKNVSYGTAAWPAGRLNVVLAAQGGLADPTKAYQTYDMIMSDRQIAYEDFRVFQPASANENIDYWSIDPGKATAAIRIGCALESRGNYTDLGGTVGMAPYLYKPWLRNGNLRAPYSLPTMAETASTANGGPTVVNGQNAHFQRAGSMVMGALLANAIGSSTTALLPGNNSYTGNLAGWPQASSPSRYATLFDILGSRDRLLSLGQLQHAPFSRYGFYSSYPFANSIAGVHVDRTATYRLGLATSGSGAGAGSGIVPRPGALTTYDPLYDLSWHLNRALWDRYFVSGVPSGLQQSDINDGHALPDARMVYARESGAPALTGVKAGPGSHAAYDRAAANLMVAGAFNINSTSEQAWRAILGGPLGVTDDSSYSESSDEVAKIVPYPRFSEALSRPGGGLYQVVSSTMKTDYSNQDGFLGTHYHGNRGLFLNDPASTSVNASAAAVVRELARTLVREIRRRGPFLSLADFVNRPIYTTKQDSGIKGAIQAAIDTTQSPGQVNPLQPLTGGSLARSIPNTGNSRNPYPSWDDEHYIGGPSSEVGSGRDSFRLLSAFAPKYLTQADILSVLGPLLSARSDTFTIRTYGESRNPVTDRVEGQAWCEVVVQRMPEYADTVVTVDPWTSPTGINQTFGRRFKVVSFRWLTTADI